MDANLKQRLVGAAVLVALAVIFLPMLIGGPDHETNGPQVSTDIPARGDRQLVTRELPLAPALPTVSTEVDTAVAAENRVATVDMMNAPARVDALSGNEVNAASAASGDVVAPAGAVTNSGTPATPVPAPVATTPTSVAPAAVPPPPASTPVVAPAPAPPPTLPAASANGNWAVNLGSYGNAANASALVSQLRGQKFDVYSEAINLDGKSVQRVRLGPYAGRAQAESARLSVLKLRSDLPTSVVSLEGEPASPTAKPAVAAGFAVQLGALATQADANALRDRARAAGFSSYVERVATGSGVLWRVRLGPELQRANAEKLKSDAKIKLGVDGNVVAHP